MQRSRWAAPMVFAGVLLILASIGWLSSVLADWEQANGSHRLRKLTATVDRSVTAPETAGLTLKEAEQLAAKWAPLPIAYSARVQTRATLGDVSANCEVFGVNGSYRDFTEVRLKTGTSFAPASVDEHSRVAVIGAKVADELFHSERVAGKTIKLFGVPFTIIGVMDDEGSLLRQMADDGIPDVLIPVTALLDLRPEARIEGIQLAARPSAVLRGETDAGDVLRAIGKNAAHFRIENHLVTHMQIGQTSLAAAVQLRNHRLVLAYLQHRPAIPGGPHGAARAASCTRLERCAPQRAAPAPEIRLRCGRRGGLRGRAMVADPVSPLPSAGLGAGANHRYPVLYGEAAKLVAATGRAGRLHPIAAGAALQRRRPACRKAVYCRSLVRPALIPARRPSLGG
ncbi:ABC transporter permease [Paenibacillus sp. P26]|nr:ABC transporter permease [Paenibacillus sp. P26]